MSDYDLSLCIHCGKSWDEHQEATAESAYLRFCAAGGAAFWSRHKTRESERARRWEFVTAAAQHAFSGRVNEHGGLGATVWGVSEMWDKLIEDERRWLEAWRYR